MKKTNAAQPNLPTESLVAAIGLGFLVVVFPFVMKDGYANITGFRFLFYTVLSAFVFVGCAVPRILRADSLRSLAGSAIRRNDPLEKTLFLFFAAMCLSAVLSEYRQASVTGNEGRFMGLVTYTAFLLTCLWLSRCYILSERTLLVFGGVMSVIAALALLQFEGVDPFRLLDDVPFEERRNFLSVFGNINVYAAYLAAAAPCAMLMSCFSEKRSSRRLFRVFSAFGFFGLMTCNSDSGYIAFGTAFLILFAMTCAGAELFRRFLALLLVFFGVIAAFSAVFHLAGGTRGLSGITEWLIGSPVPYAGAALCLAGLWLAPRLCSPKRLRILRIAVLSAAALAAAALLGAVIYFSVFNTTADIGYPEKYLRFNDSWGTDRGYVWRRLLAAYRDAPLLRKLFGWGEDTVAVILAQSCGSEMVNRLGYVFDNAHNEYLQYLVTTGSFGFGAYLALLTAALSAGFSKKSPIEKKALALGVAAYAAQAFFNILQPITTPYLFLLIALIGSGVPSHVIVTNAIDSSAHQEV